MEIILKSSSPRRKDLLKEMGYKKKQIENVLSNINDPSLNLDGLIKLALARMMN